MHVFKLVSPVLNFGDDMNDWFWDEIFPEHREVYTDAMLLGIGSILWKQNFEAADQIVVLGSGVGVGVLPRKLPRHLRFSWVRGPMTAKALDLDRGAALTDPASLCPLLDRFADRPSSTKRTVFVPHVGTAGLDIEWDRVAADADVDYVTPAADGDAVIKRIAAADLVITESLHGAIIADAFRVPWVPISLSPSFNHYKWRDWASSLEMDVRVEPGLVHLNRAYAFLTTARRLLKGQFRRPITANEDPTSDIHVPAVAMAGNRTFGISKDDKGDVRRIIKRFHGLVERMIARDLRRVKTSKAFLSKEGVLRARQDAMMGRIDLLRQERASLFVPRI
ncbi:MAG: polysaccharide pyruvyl transferase family protein [Pseudomonadota bacterium]